MAIRVSLSIVKSDQCDIDHFYACAQAASFTGEIEAKWNSPMEKRYLTEKIQREILMALAAASPDPLTGRQYFAAFGRYSDSE